MDTEHLKLLRLQKRDGAQAVVDWLQTQMETSPDFPRQVIDAHAPYEGRPHTHPHTH